MYIQVKDAIKSYGDKDGKVYALNKLNFSLEQGKVCVILGASGSGKSTLLNMLGGLDSLTSGEIIVDNKVINTLSKRELTEYRKNNVGFVFQYYNLIADLKVRENIEVVSSLTKNSLPIDDVLSQLEIDDLSNRYPSELSGGQSQRVAIARAIVKKPKLLLCDEITGALDTKASMVVLSYIEKVNKLYGTTILIITHNEQIANMADVVIRLRDGQIVSNLVNEHKLSASELSL